MRIVEPMSLGLLTRALEFRRRPQRGPDTSAFETPCRSHGIGFGRFKGRSGF